MRKTTRFADQEAEAELETVTEPLIHLYSIPNQLPTPFRDATIAHASPPLSPARGVFRDKYGRYRTLYDQRARTTALVSIAGILERSNEQTLPALYKYMDEVSTPLLAN